MADKNPSESDARFATRIDPAKEGLTKEQLDLVKRLEHEQWKKKIHTLRTRNVVTGLAIGALVLGICILTMRKERVIDEMDEEAKRARLQGPKTGAN
ncbi:Cytochrome c oxidase assembly factor 3 -like protein, mitochondrial [Collichthys lucidus]|uniref:Cytochrome c oxidase assembly factor 3 n=1 Tax=Collichthys lucidus TaxID=240159 RepID=A0A4U5VMB1_COLLU|nr:Cytochrome c oxidase assembly factor 3 -like protein, mitochondrial [Collichthys lucidus]